MSKVDRARIGHITIAIERTIESEYRAEGSRKFWPEQFIDAGVGSDEEIAHAFKSLEATCKVDLHADVFCAEGKHTVWGGLVAELPAKPVPCKRCGRRSIATENRVHVYAKIATAWRGSLDLEKVPPAGKVPTGPRSSATQPRAMYLRTSSTSTAASTTRGITTIRRHRSWPQIAEPQFQVSRSQRH